MLALVPDDIPAEELVDDLDGLEQHRAADPDLRPVAADHVLVECLSSSESQPEAPGVHGAQRRGGMGYHCGVVSESGAGHRGPERKAGSLAQRSHERPGERCVALLRCPRMEVLAHHEPGAESSRLCLCAPVEEIGGVELLEHRRVADLGHAVKGTSRELGAD